MRTNTAKRGMESGSPAVGAVLSLDSVFAGEILSRGGFDFVLVDNQHGPWDRTSSRLAFRSISLGPAIPMARVKSNDFYAIGALLDGGALGIVVPMVNSVEQAQKAAFAARYPPRGGRSAGALLAEFHGPRYLAEIDDEVFLAVQIETAQALENVEEILVVEGVDGCWIGPSDLAASLGLDTSNEADAKELEAACMRVRDACRKTDKIPGIWGRDNAMPWIDRGFLFVTGGSDAGLIRGGARTTLEKLKRLP